MRQAVSLSRRRMHIVLADRMDHMDRPSAEGLNVNKVYSRLLQTSPNNLTQIVTLQPILTDAEDKLVYGLLVDIKLAQVLY